MTDQEIFAGVRDCVAESLALGADEVQATSRFREDLGGDSLDLVDVIFMMEKKFKIKLRDNEMDFLARLDLSSAELGKDGVLSREAVEKLSEWIPALKNIPATQEVKQHQIFSLMTIETLCIIVKKKVSVAA